MTTLRIVWNSLDLPAWEARFAQLRRANLLQSYAYAQGASQFNRQRVRWGLMSVDGREAGLVQVFEASFMGLHAVMLDRGPLWFAGFDTPENITAFFKAFDEEFPRRFGRRRRVIPEMPQEVVMPAGYRAVKAAAPYQTIWLDLTQDEEFLRSQLKKNWRNALSKAERAALRLEWDKPQEGLAWLLAHHQAHRTMKNFQAASPAFIRTLARYFMPRGDMLVGRVFSGAEAVAGVLFFRHGGGATYQVGWSGEEGRALNAHQLLLWQGLLQLKAAGVRDLDLGGVNDQAEGVSRFKEGLGGEIVTLPGIYL